jgi:hypothetical protein
MTILSPSIPASHTPTHKANARHSFLFQDGSEI